MRDTINMIKTAVIIATALLGAGIQGNVFSFTVKSTEAGDFIHWPRGKTAIFYAVGDEAPLPRPRSIRALSRAFENWEEHAGNIRFIYTGPAPGRGAARDGVNSINWVDNGWRHGDEIIALSTTWYADSTGVIEEVDIEFNARDYDWLSGDSPRIHETALHEIGHLLGIDHSFNPKAVMHGEMGPNRPVVRTLNRDDVEALTFLYPPGTISFDRYDLPVLFYPEDFPGKSSNLSSLTSPAPFGRDLISLGSIDMDGDGYRSELLAAYRDRSGGKILEIRDPDPEEGIYPPLLAPPVRLGDKIAVLALTGIDLDRDGERQEIAVLNRWRGEERITFYREFVPDALSGPPLAVITLSDLPANNVVGMTALRLTAGREHSLAILRAEGSDFFLHLYQPPLIQGGLEPSAVIRIPGLHRGSRLLGLVSLDADGDGIESDPVLLEQTPEGEHWLHAFRLIERQGPHGFDLSYLASAALPRTTGGVLPARIAALDLNRDGYFNELIIFSSRD